MILSALDKAEREFHKQYMQEQNPCIEAFNKRREKGYGDHSEKVQVS